MYFDAGVSWWGPVLAVAVAVLLGYGAYRRPVVPLSLTHRGTLVGLRAATLLLLLLVLFRPVRTEPASLGDAVVPVLLDLSRSMRVVDAAGRSRIDQAVALARDRVVPLLAPAVPVEVLGFGDALVDVALETTAADARRTDLAGALEAVAERYRGRPVAGMVVISDGGETGARAAASVAGELGVPLYTVGVGAPRPGPDREVIAVTAGVATATDSLIDLNVSAVSHGYGSAPFEIRLLEDGALSQVRRVVPPGNGQPVRLTFRAAPKPDVATLYTVEVPTASRELVIENNRRSVLVPPPTRRRRVLMIEGSPGHDHSFLKRVWHADPGIALDAVVRKGLNDRGEYTFYVQGDPARTPALATGYPLTREALFRYDAVVLANIEPGFFRPKQLEMTAAFVADRGGGLLLLGPATLDRDGLAGSALEAAVPVELVDQARMGDYRGAGGHATLVLTADGAGHAMMQLAPTVDETRARWERVPALAGAVGVGDVKPGASVLAVATDERPGVTRPLIVVHRYGGGRAMVFAGRAAWRWRMLLPAEERTYETFWGQVARWLGGAAPDPISVTTRGGGDPGGSMHLEVRVSDADHAPILDAAPVVTVTGPGGGTEVVRPVLGGGGAGLYGAELSPRDPGVYRVEAVVDHHGDRLGAASTWFLVGGADPELADPWLDEAALQRTAEASGGRYVEQDDITALRRLVVDGMTADVAPTVRPLWHDAWVFLILAGALAAEWSLRRRWGLR